MSVPAVTLSQGHVQGSFFIAGTRLLIERTRNPHGFALHPASGAHEAVRWLDDTGLRHQRFDRRSDLLDVVRAHAAARGLPLHAEPAVTLHRRSDGSHVTREGDYEVRPHIPAPSRPGASRSGTRRTGWEITSVQHPRAGTRRAPTLNSARQIIADMRTYLPDPDTERRRLQAELARAQARNARTSQPAPSRPRRWLTRAVRTLTGRTQTP